MLLPDLLAVLLADVCRRVSAGEISGAHLARLCGVSQPHLSSVITGRRALTLGLAVELQRVLSIDSADLLEAARTGGPVRRWFDDLAA